MSCEWCRASRRCSTGVCRGTRPVSFIIFSFQLICHHLGFHSSATGQVADVVGEQNGRHRSLRVVVFCFGYEIKSKRWRRTWAGWPAERVKLPSASEPNVGLLPYTYGKYLDKWIYPNIQNDALSFLIYLANPESAFIPTWIWNQKLKYISLFLLFIDAKMTYLKWDRNHNIHLVLTEIFIFIAVRASGHLVPSQVWKKIQPHPGHWGLSVSNWSKPFNTDLKLV